ncbi:Uncharacterised protein [Mycobacteroides abscessus subsp. abscessus]|nr:Uncharacterised protein [Mycobacteroides abscessus subsp. abscessus]
MPTGSKRRSGLRVRASAARTASMSWAFHAANHSRLNVSGSTTSVMIPGRTAPRGSETLWDRTRT